MSLPGSKYGGHMDSAVESMQTVAEVREDAMRLLSLLVGLVLGFFVAAWFYGAGGALTIAGKEIGPDILAHVRSHGSGRTIEPGAKPDSPRVGSPDEPSDSSGSTSNSPPSGSTQNTPPSTVGDNSPPSGIGGNAYITVRWPK
jgi:hypothetical protein